MAVAFELSVESADEHVRHIVMKVLIEFPCCCRKEPVSDPATSVAVLSFQRLSIR